MPGEAISLTCKAIPINRNAHQKHSVSPCLFEYSYLATPPSIIDKILVYKMRMSLGQKLAEKILHEFSDHDMMW